MSFSSLSAPASNSNLRVKVFTLVAAVIVLAVVISSQVKITPMTTHASPDLIWSEQAPSASVNLVISAAGSDEESAASSATKSFSASQNQSAATSDDVVLDHVPDALSVRDSTSSVVASSSSSTSQSSREVFSSNSVSASFAHIFHVFANESAALVHSTSSTGTVLVKANLARFDPRGTEVGRRMQECNAQMRAGVYWNYERKECLKLEGFFAPLHPFEASVEELSCSPDSLYEKFHYRTLSSSSSSSPSSSSSAAADFRDYKWVPYGFRNFSDADRTVEHFGIDMRPLQRAAAGDKALQKMLLRDYSRFMFFTSWQFRQWLPWTPRPIVSVVAATSSSSAAISLTQYSFRAFHDPTLDNLYVIRNFCVAPFGGLSGFNPTQFEKPSAKLDERSKFHTRDAGVWGGFFRKLTVLNNPAPYYDERPVVFMPRLAYSHPNIHHNFARFVSTLGILDLPAFARNVHEPEPADSQQQQQQQQQQQFPRSSEFAPNSHTDHWNSQQGLKPLIVFVFSRMTKKKFNADRTRVSPYAFWLRVLDLPVAVVNSRNDPTDFMQDVFGLSRHSGAKISNKDKSSSSTGSSTGTAPTRFHDSTPFCAQRAVIYQNCHPAGSTSSCDWKNPHGDLEEYSFGSFSRLTAPKQAMLRRYLRLLHNCLPVGFATANRPAARSDSDDALHPVYAPISLRSKTILPQVMFNVRSSARTLAHLPLIADDIRRGLAGFVSDVLFREPWRGSRAQYVEDMRQSDIFFGNHGGAMAEVVLLRPRPVVVEIQAKMFACREAGCWFGMMVDAPLGAHWIAQVTQDTLCCAGCGTNTNSSNVKTFHVPASFIVDILRDAVCKWYNMNPGRAAEGGMPEQVRVYCKLFAPRVNGGSKYRSSFFVNRNGGAGAAFATDANAMLRTLKDEFGVVVENQLSALRFVERLRSVNSKLPNKAGLQEIGALRSEAPLLFQVLLQRYVDVSLGVQGVFRGSVDKMEKIVCLEANDGITKICLYRA